MLFNSLPFLAFLPVVLTVYFTLGHRNQNRFLLLASYVFYGWWDVRFLGLLALSTFVDYHCGWGMGRTESQSRRRQLLLLSLVTNLGILGFFKYFNFFLDSAAPLIQFFGMEADDLTLRIILPVGVSFYTFQSLSYTVDVFRRRCAPIKAPIDFALYVSFFPQLVAGPIERAVNLLPQIRAPRRYRRDHFVDGLWLILVGYLKKVVIADRCGAIVSGAFTGTALPFEGLDTWLVVYAFAFQIYGDFAGYTDIARGTARLFGFELMKNFGAPYFVTNPANFWRHWHISLSTWLRDYLYIPLGGNRKGSVRTYLNLSITMLLGGLWHGAGWAFVAWGFFHGFLLVVHRLTGPQVTRIASRFPDSLYWRRIGQTVGALVFFHVTCIGWLIFRVGSFTTEQAATPQVPFILKSLYRMFASFSLTEIDLMRVVVPLGIVALLLQVLHEANEKFSQWPVRRQVAGVVGCIILIATLGVFGGTEFIYFQF